MRILFTGVPGLGHLLPQLPLARAFQAQGHGVAVVVPESMVPVLAAEGIEVLAAGSDIPAMVVELAQRTGVDPMTGLTPEIEAEAFAGVRPDLSADELLATARAWQPDLIVHDQYDMVAPLVAAVLDVPAALVTLGPDTPDFTALAAPKLDERYQARGLTRRPYRFVLDICPSGLQRDGWVTPAGWMSLRPEAHRAPEGTPAPTVAPLAAQPRILVTFGTLFTNPVVLGPILRGLSATGAGLRATLGLTAAPEDFDVDLARVNFEPFVPLSELLRDIDLVVGHGGAGTTLAALAGGIPLVLLPQGADQFIQAERAVTAGAAAQLLPGEASPEAVVATVRKVLAEPSYRDNAEKIAGQIAAMSSPAEVAEALVAELT
ncbi:glycosyltransferase [Micromonospora sp. NPDC050397]|uniref:glycosyltransferase n=1 Tax=Micromonospora sp. NPDC050397 TaxID=3364279 RepID=UPI00384D9820